MERVTLTRCPPDAADIQIVRATEEAVRGLGDLGPRLRDARTVAVKINAGVDRIVLTDGRQTELTEPAVIEGVVRALRAATDAELLVGDAPTGFDAAEIYARLGLPERLAPYPGVRLVDFNASELATAEMAHPGPMFRRYRVPREVSEADAVVSVAKMKAHQSLGCTLCIKNLFGWMPTRVYGVPRLYLHDRLVRLPRVLSDLAQWLRPCLNVVDGIVAANKSEWGGEALRPGVLLAGTNAVATDSVGARVMGFDPAGDYPDHPYLYRRNVLRLAAESGLGPLRADRVDVLGPAPESVATPFTVRPYGGGAARPEEITRRDDEIRRGAACVARYRERQADLADRYGAGRYLALLGDEVLWDGPDMATLQRLWHESGRDWRDGPQLLVRCLPPEDEIEAFDWYGREAARLPEPGEAARPARRGNGP